MFIKKQFAFQGSFYKNKVRFLSLKELNMTLNVEAVGNAPQKAQIPVVAAPRQTTSIAIENNQEKKTEGVSSDNKLLLTLGGLAIAGIGIYIACRKGNASTANKAATTAAGSVGDSVPKAETVMPKTVTDKIAERFSNKLTDASKVKFVEKASEKGISYIREIGRKSGRTVISKYSDGQEVGRIIKKTEILLYVFQITVQNCLTENILI